MASSLYEPNTAVAYAESAPGFHSPLERRRRISATTFPELGAALAEAERAQALFAALPQERVDAIFKAACRAVNTSWMVSVRKDEARHDIGPCFSGGGEPEFRNYTCTAGGTARTLSVGTIAAPNPALTAICKSLDAIKSRRALVFSAYPQISQRITDAVDSIYWAAVEAGAPEGFLWCVALPGVNLSQTLLCAGRMLNQPVHDAYAQPPAKRCPEKAPVTLLAFRPVH